MPAFTPTPSRERADTWPALPLDAWQETLTTLHMWTQIVGKIRMEQTPVINHWWNVTFHVSCRGLTSRPIPYGTRSFEMEFDFIDHRLHIRSAQGTSRSVALAPRTVASFYGEVMQCLDEMGFPVRIWPRPVETTEQIPFDVDEEHKAYDREWAHRFWQVLVQVDRVLEEFRSRFLGKSSPSHFFWGSFDMALTRFSGREAPEHPGVPGVADSITREAYSHECASFGFWPGHGLGDPAFYAYAYPEPDGFREAAIEPGEAYYLEEMGEFVLPYDAVRNAADPDRVLLGFFQSSYEAAADRGGWQRQRLDRPQWRD